MYNKCKANRKKNKTHEFVLMKTKEQKDLCVCSYMTLMLSVVLVFAPCFSSIVSASDKPVFNIDFFWGWNGYYRPMEWTPMEITVSSTSENPFGAELTLSSQQDGLNTLNIISDFVLTPDWPEHKPLVTKIAYSNQKCSLKLDQTDGKNKKTLWSHEYNTWNSPNSGKNSTINEQDLLIGIVEIGKFGLLRLDKQSVSKFQEMNGNVYIGTKQAEVVPWDWTGFVSLDLLILYDPDWSQFKEQQLKAIAEWVSNGGKMLLVLGSNPPTGENPLTNIVPFDFLQAKQVSVSQGQLYNWGLAGNNSETITLKALVPKSGLKFYEGDFYQDNQYLFAVANTGFGRVGVLGFDPSDLSDFQNVYSSQFWVKIIQSVLKVKDNAKNNLFAQRSIEYVPDTSTYPGGTAAAGALTRGVTMQRNPYNYVIGRAYSLNNKVMEFLYSEIKPLSVWFVILLLGALAVLLGPVDYKFLKHIDRLPLTWLTCSFWIIVFTVGAYYGVQNIRGGKMQLKVVSVLDGIEDESTAWSTHYSGLFASRSDSYQLEGLKADQWWSGIAPTQESLSYYSNELGTRRIYCIQEDGGNLPYALPVNIWDIQCMLTESPVEKMPFSADVQRSGNNITVTINNESDSAINGGYVLMDGNYGIEFSKVPAHSIREFQKQSNRLPYWENISFSSSRGSSTSSFKNEDAFFAQGCLQRTLAINDYLQKGAAVVCVRYENAPMPFKVKDRSRSFEDEHIQLARLVVFPN